MSVSECSYPCALTPPPDSFGRIGPGAVHRGITVMLSHFTGTYPS